MPPSLTPAQVINGLRAETGAYDLENLTPEILVKAARGQKHEPAHQAELVDKGDPKNRAKMRFDGDHKNFAETGWAVIFPAGEDPHWVAVREALQPLLNQRRAQAGDLYKEFFDTQQAKKGVRPTDTALQFLARHGGSPGPAVPAVMPYYVLLVGGPEVVPYTFQYQLDVQYAVGRLSFATPEEYAQYAHNVVQAETQRVQLARHMALWGPRTPGDAATELSADYLLTPLAAYLQQKQPTWAASTYLAEQATKAQLGQLLSGGAASPALLFTASHGLALDIDNPLQQRHQGALVSHDWPGPRQRGPIGPDWYFSADDLPAQNNLLGMLTFFFACYGAGTPQFDDYLYVGSREPIAPRPFVAALPQKLLLQGALAAVGHVERAWGYSFRWGNNAALSAFTGTLNALLDGFPIGSAMERFNERYAELAAHLTSLIQSYNDRYETIEAVTGQPPTELDINSEELTGYWTAQNDSRGYVVLGDPAVRLAVGEGATPPVERPALISVPTPATATAPVAHQSFAPAAPSRAEPAPADLILRVTTPAADGSPLFTTIIALQASADDEKLLAVHLAQVQQALAQRAEVARRLGEMEKLTGA